MKERIRNKIEELLSKEYYCSVSDLNGKGTIYAKECRAVRYLY